jgi:hypothetical protein
MKEGKQCRQWTKTPESVLDVHTTVYRLPVENIVVHNKNDRVHSTTVCLSYCDMRYIATAMQNYCINKELIERGNRGGMHSPKEIS